MQRPDVFDALMRIKEVLDGNTQDHAISIARHDLGELTEYITAIQATMDDIHIQAKAWEVIPNPWELFEKKLEEIETRNLKKTDDSTKSDSPSPGS